MAVGALVVEFDRRIPDRWSASAKIFALFNVDEKDVQLYPVRRDSFIEWILTWNFWQKLQRSTLPGSTT